MMSDSKWIEEARGIAARCWCDETTKHLIMEPALAEVFARVIASCMETAAIYSVNAEYWRVKVPPHEDKIPGEYAAVAILPPFSDEHAVKHADVYANRWANHASFAAQAAGATAKAYAEFAQIAEREKVDGYAEFTKAALSARYAASAAMAYFAAAAKASSVFTDRRAKFDAEYAEYIARPTVHMPNERTEAEAEADIAALVKVAEAAIELYKK